MFQFKQTLKKHSSPSSYFEENKQNVSVSSQFSLFSHGILRSTQQEVGLEARRRREVDLRKCIALKHEECVELCLSPGMACGRVLQAVWRHAPASAAELQSQTVTACDWPGPLLLLLHTAQTVLWRPRHGLRAMSAPVSWTLSLDTYSLQTSCWCWINKCLHSDNNRTRFQYQSGRKYTHIYLFAQEFHLLWIFTSHQTRRWLAKNIVASFSISRLNISNINSVHNPESRSQTRLHTMLMCLYYSLILCWESEHLTFIKLTGSKTWN